MADLGAVEGHGSKSPTLDFLGSSSRYLERRDLKEQSFEDGLWAGMLEGFSFPGDACGSF